MIGNNLDKKSAVQRSSQYIYIYIYVLMAVDFRWISVCNHYIDNGAQSCLPTL